MLNQTQLKQSGEFIACVYGKTLPIPLLQNKPCFNAVCWVATFA